MINFFKPKTTVTISSHVCTKIADYSVRSHPIETGGILLGWWQGKNVHIDDISEVVDPNATHNGWVRHQTDAQEVLNGVLNNQPNQDVGYVGDWHSHPASIGASGTDLASLKRASRQYQKPIVSIIRLENGSFEIHSALNGRLSKTIIAK